MLSTGFMGAEKANIPIGGTVVVLAQGPVGLMATAGARLRGAGLVIGVESVPSRQKLARTYGADEIVDFTREDVLDRVLELTDGERADAAVEALGADATFQTAVKITKPGGTISNIGYFGEGEFVRIPRVEWGWEWRTRRSRRDCAPAAGCGWSACCNCCRTTASIPRA
ncbi:zinc-binding dehydrogenase [Prauserella oleivorans]